MPSLSVSRTACKLRLQVPSDPRAPVAGYLIPLQRDVSTASRLRAPELARYE